VCEHASEGCMCRAVRCKACIWYCSTNCDRCDLGSVWCWYDNVEDWLQNGIERPTCSLANAVRYSIFDTKDVELVHGELLTIVEEVTKIVKISELSDFIAAGVDVKTGDVLTFKDAGTIRSAEETPFGREVFQIKVELPDGNVKTLTMNRTSQRNIAKQYGDETENWVGKQAVVTLVKQNVRGTMKDVIYLNPLQKKSKTN